MDDLRRKYTFRVDGDKQILVKRTDEREEHVLMKALMSQLYSQKYLNLKIETSAEVEERYKPDILAINELNEIKFWGECGYVAIEKIKYLLHQYSDTHLSFGKWDSPVKPFKSLIEDHLPKSERNAPVDFVNFPEESKEKIESDGKINIEWDDVEVIQWK